MTFHTDFVERGETSLVGEGREGGREGSEIIIRQWVTSEFGCPIHGLLRSGV